jgi:hypothetical protein
MKKNLLILGLALLIASIVSVSFIPKAETGKQKLPEKRTPLSKEAMSSAILYIDRSEIREGKLAELKAAIKELATFVETKEPRAISYNIYLSEDNKHLTVAQIHPNAASLEYHMEIAGPAFPKFKEMVRLKSIDIYGKPSEKLLQQLHRKAELLGSRTVTVHEWHAGFMRLGTDK